jgi:hypothetical protein
MVPRMQTVNINMTEITNRCWEVIPRKRFELDLADPIAGWYFASVSS